MSRVFNPIQKHRRILLPKWLAAANGQTCTWPGCGKCDGTIVAAHSNLLIHGKGIGKKADDLYIAYLCAECHYEYDYGKNLTREQKTVLFMMAMSATWRVIFELGLLFLPRGSEAEFYEQHPPF